MQQLFLEVSLAGRQECWGRWQRPPFFLTAFSHPSPTPSPAETARSLSEAYALRNELLVLELKASPELRCVNLMCEKVGKGCACRLALTLGRLSKIERLDISGNSLEIFPDSLFQLATLKELDISGNPIKALPDSFANLKGLTKLTARGTQLPAAETREKLTALLPELKEVHLE